MRCCAAKVSRFEIAHVESYSTSLTAPACVVDWVVNDLSDQRTISWIGCDAPRAGSVYVRATTSTTTSISITSRKFIVCEDVQVLN